MLQCTVEIYDGVRSTPKDGNWRVLLPSLQGSLREHHIQISLIGEPMSHDPPFFLWLSEFDLKFPDQLCNHLE